jgi:hypothetical protein
MGTIITGKILNINFLMISPFSQLMLNGIYYVEFLIIIDHLINKINKIIIKISKHSVMGHTLLSQE